jgi:hypothetical protein
MFGTLNSSGASTRRALGEVPCRRWVTNGCADNMIGTSVASGGQERGTNMGHYAYYGITGNIWRLQQYRHQVTRIWHKWRERRTRGRMLLWANFNAFLARHPLPARIIHRYTNWNEALA